MLGTLAACLRVPPPAWARSAVGPPERRADAGCRIAPRCGSSPAVAGPVRSARLLVFVFGGARVFSFYSADNGVIFNACSFTVSIRSRNAMLRSGAKISAMSHSRKAFSLSPSSRYHVALSR